MTEGIDEADKKILLLLSENPEISQGEISEHLRISQPAVSTRIRHIKEKGILTHLIGANIKKVQLFLAMINIVANNTERISDFFNKCPLYLNSFQTSGRYNLTVLLIGENVRSVMSCVNNHLRQGPLVEEIKDMEFNLVVTPIRDFIVPIKPNLDKKKTTSCSEIDCSGCTFYTSDRCLGCPGSILYKGTLL